MTMSYSHALPRMKWAIGILIAAFAFIILSPAGAAHADGIYTPPAGTGNGYDVYLSRACHDGNDGVAGGACITNIGCSSMSENTESSILSSNAAFAVAGGSSNLVARGYRVRIGTGTAGQNIANSNAWGANIHMPLHTNAKTESCSNTTASTHGTMAMYVSTSGSTCSTWVRDIVGAVSPGTNDVKVYRTDLGELNQTNAVACYLESEFHTWTTGRNWIRSSSTWSGRVGMSIDGYLGYP